jgi:hypothetical protein
MPTPNLTTIERISKVLSKPWYTAQPKKPWENIDDATREEIGRKYDAAIDDWFRNRRDPRTVRQVMLDFVKTYADEKVSASPQKEPT